METINDRLDIILNSIYNGNQASFARSIGLMPTGLSNYLGRRRSKPNADMLANIVRCANINPYWLLLGEGDMLGPGDHRHHTVTVSDSTVSGNAIVANEVSKSDSDMSCEVNHLRERLALLERLLSDKERIIALYERLSSPK